MTEPMDYYDQGANAAQAGHKESSCPYEDGPIKDFWMIGFSVAKAIMTSVSDYQVEGRNAYFDGAVDNPYDGERGRAWLSGWTEARTAESNHYNQLSELADGRSLHERGLGFGG